MLISMVGSLVTDNMVDNFGIQLTTSTIFFTVALIATFALWYAGEHTLSIHTVFTNRREAFYWLAIQFTFARGTAAGDLVSEQFGFGYFNTGILFDMIIASLTFGYFFLGLDPILGFWLAAPTRRLARRFPVSKVHHALSARRLASRTDRLGGEGSYFFNAGSFHNQATASVFPLDRSFLSGLGTSRHLNNISDGGVGNTNGLSSVALTLTGCQGRQRDRPQQDDQDWRRARREAAGRDRLLQLFRGHRF